MDQGGSGFTKARTHWGSIIPHGSRSSFPRAINRDRSESKSGLDKSIRKNGAGAHSWGSIADEREHELAAMDDEEYDMEQESFSDNLSSSSECMWYRISRACSS
ncbi:hypothetical protein C0992_007948 [Termitomyces sp. T32_za158]|nr:hypothetical protein C0992_007948 [Termitomyces sp. T32_za158]